MDEVSVGVGVGELYRLTPGLALVQGMVYNVGVGEGERFGEAYWDSALVDVPSAALMSGMGEDYIRKLCRLGKLEAYRQAGRWLVRLRSLEAWERKTEGRGRPPAKPRPSGELGVIRIWQLDAPGVGAGADADSPRLPGLE